MSISKHYNPGEAEQKWYPYWMDKDYFKGVPDDREPYAIVIPPPNVTGVLHMGHMLNNTIQDVLARKARLDNKNVCWVPGTDHASIATEAKVVKLLREKGIKKSDLTREEFLAHAFDWKDKYGGIILQQLQKLGASCDWDKTAFTMDEPRSKWVTKTFVDLYKKDKLYRGLRMVNWDPEALTVLSNEEVIYSDEQSRLFKVKYQVEGTNEYLTIATTRPETILGDSAIAVHPDDERYTHLHGKRVIVPLVNRSIPIIADDYVDIEFGTGALKVTPAHDMNDYDIGQRHNLEVIEILNDNGTLNDKCGIESLIGEDRFKARRVVAKLLDDAGNLVEIENYNNKVGRSERTNAVVEPKLSLQWYVKMPELADAAFKGVDTGDIKFYPDNQRNVYNHWVTNIRDWCISRQLWWGHQIPAWYYNDEIFVAETAEEALAQAKENHPNITIEDLKRDEDAMDTWFSSWLWPMSVFNDEERAYYYPTQVLVTGWDIIFLWVARMVMAGYEWMDEKPFEEVYFTGMVRDKQGRKMSKSLGNSPDALGLIEQYGADGVRFGMLSCSPAGGDLLFDEKLCEQGRNFSNKIWNALRLVNGWEVDTNKATPIENTFAQSFLATKQNELLAQLELNFKTYRLSEAVMNIYTFIWDDFCSWYLEIIKPSLGEKVDQETYNNAIAFFESICTILHPFMPFITEEIWHTIKTDRAEGDDCMMSRYPTAGTVDAATVTWNNKLKDIVSKLRDLRNKNGISPKETLDVFYEDSKTVQGLVNVPGLKNAIQKLANIGQFEAYSDELSNAVAFNVDTDKFYTPIEKEIDVEAEKERLTSEIKYAEGFIKSVEKKLSNERFVSNAPEAVITKERQKLSDGQKKLTLLQESLAQL